MAKTILIFESGVNETASKKQSSQLKLGFPRCAA